MANYNTLKAEITSAIYDNTTKAITGGSLQAVLLSMVDALGSAGYVFGGVVETSYTPTTSDSKIFYVSKGAGTYTGFNNAVIDDGEIAFFSYDGTQWVAETVTVGTPVSVSGNLQTGLTLATITVGGIAYPIKAQALSTSVASGDSAPVTSGAVFTALTNAIISMSSDVSSNYVPKTLTVSAGTGLEGGGALSGDITISLSSAAQASLALADTALQASDITGKADKVSGAVSGDLAALDADGNLTDSGVAASVIATKADKDTDAVSGNMAEFDSNGNPVDSGIAADNVAQQDGYYETLTAGMAENIVGTDTVDAEYVRRQSGGDNEIGTGLAYIQSLKGKTLVWNQMVKDWTDSSNWKLKGTTTAQIVNGALEITYASTGSGNAFGIKTAPFVNGHTVLVYLNYSGTMTYKKLGSEGDVSYSGTTTSAMTQPEIKLLTASSTGSGGAIWFYTNTANTVTITDLYIVDLTQMFGSGSEPSTVAEFTNLFPFSYYAYNAGELINNKATDIVTTGFNQWDEQWELGTINSSGVNTTATDRIRSKNYIPALPSTTYYFKTAVGLSVGDVFSYDSNKSFISGQWSKGNNTFTTPNNCAYIKIAPQALYGSTYNNDICINFSDTNRNGEYEPYETHTLAVPVTTATSGGSAVFAEGMRSAGTAYDEMTATKAIKNIGVVDLGTLNWIYDSAHLAFYCSVIANMPASARAVCSKYETNTLSAGAAFDKALSTQSYYGTGRSFVKDSSYTDAITFKAAMSGVYLYYELATPTEYTLDNTLDLTYQVNNLGTEAMLPENTSTPTTAPIAYTVKYALNAADTIRNIKSGYISKASMDAILTALRTAGVISAYTLTYNSSTGAYTCSITQ